eukprot:TRINITY_DN17769_c0_g1_i1.p1 TRINITY_DN17769_c0_g1~~TRINITY_DN17769_c0_g1_i1.p1  ORF type:complete len:2573 (+),score=460.92 TRINITY_DN17769_c0_g1_i1:100-7818(+)
MQKLKTAVAVEGYYDDELGDMNHHYDSVVEHCETLRRYWQFRKPRKAESPEASAPNSASASGKTAATGRSPSKQPSTESPKPPPKSGDASSLPTRSTLFDLVQKLINPPDRSSAVPLLADRCREEVLDSAVPGHGLEETRNRLIAFFERRRTRLTLQCDLITGRLRRHLRSWESSRQAAPVVQSRLRILGQEIEAAEQRIRRLGDAPDVGIRAKAASATKDHSGPIPKAGTGKKLFDYNDLYTEAIDASVFKADVAVCLREMIWEDYTTRLLRRFLLQMQHLPITHRQELLRSTIDLSSSALPSVHEQACSPLPLTWIPKSREFDDRLQTVLNSLGLRILLQTDGGHAFSAATCMHFVTIFEEQSLQLDFKPIEASREPELDSSSSPLRNIHLKEDNGWLGCVPLQPRVSLQSQEQSFLMRGRASTDADESNFDPSGLHEGFKAEMALVSQQTDPASLERRFRQLAAERASLPVPAGALEAAECEDAANVPADEGEAEPLQSLDQAPEHLLFAYYMLRHLRSRALRRQLLGLLNLFRFAQQKVSHGVLVLQASATSKGSAGGIGSREQKPRTEQESPVEAHAVSIGRLPPSLPFPHSVVCRGMTVKPLLESIAAVSDAEMLVRSDPVDKTGSFCVVDGNGLPIMHDAALADLSSVEQELLVIGSYALRKAPESTRGYVDTAGLLSELMECEVAFLQSKWNLLEVYLCAFEKLSDPAGRWDLAQRVVDIMAQRPYFDLNLTGTGFHFAEAYAAATAAAKERAQLLSSVLEHQVRSEAAAAEKLARRERLSLQCTRAIETELGPKSGVGLGPQPSHFAGPEMDDHPHLSLEHQLAHPMEGFPPARSAVPGVRIRRDQPEASTGILDFCDSSALACQVDVLIEEVAARLVEDLAPEPCYRHCLERACTMLLSKEWALQMASDETALSPVFWGDLADDPDWLMLQVEEAIEQWGTEGADGAEICLETDPELYSVPHAEAVLRVSCRLLEHVRLRRRLLDGVSEVRALEAGLTRQAGLVGVIPTLRATDALPDYTHDVGDDLPNPHSGSSRVASPLLAAEVSSSFNVDFASQRGIRAGLQAVQLQELRLVLQNQLVGRWLLVSCGLHNTLMLDEILRRRVLTDARMQPAEAAAGKSTVRSQRSVRPEAMYGMQVLRQLMSGSRLSKPWWRPFALAHVEEKQPKLIAKTKAAAGALLWPGPMKTVIINSVGGAMREYIRSLKRHVDELPNGDARLACLVLYRQRALGHCNAFMLERACDLLLRVQAANAAASIRTLVAMLPRELSPFHVSSEESRHILLEQSGALHSILNLPRVEEVLALRGSDCPNLSKTVRDAQSVLPNPFPVLREVFQPPSSRGPGPRRPPVVGSSASIWAVPRLEMHFTGAATMTLLLLRELVPITSLSIQAASVPADQILILSLHHAVETAPPFADCDENNEMTAREQAIEQVLAEEMLGPVNLENLDRERVPRTPEQQTWDALSGIRADFLRLQLQLKALKDDVNQVRPVLALLRQRRTCSELRALVLLHQADKAAIQDACLQEASEIHRWATHVEGYPLEGGSRLVTAAAAFDEPYGAFKSDFPILNSSDSPPDPRVPYEKLADRAIQSLAIAAPRGMRPFLAGPIRFCQLGDQLDDYQAALRPRLDPAKCSHNHPMFHALLRLYSPPTAHYDALGPFLGGGDAVVGNGEFITIPAHGPALWALPPLPLQSFSRALCLLPAYRRQQMTDQQVRYDIDCEYLRVRDDELESLAEEEGFGQTCYTTHRLRNIATSFLRLAAPARTKELVDEANLELNAQISKRDAEEEAEKEEDDEEEKKEVHPLIIKAALEQNMEKAGALVAAADMAAEGEGDWLILTKETGPGAKEEREAGRSAAKDFIAESHHVAGSLTGIVVKRSLNFAVAAVERLKVHLQSQLESEGGKAAMNFAKHLLERAVHVTTYDKDGLGAWVIKNSDLDESVQDVGRHMLQWAVVCTADQIASSRARIIASAEQVRKLESDLQRVRWSLRWQRGEVETTLTSLVSDRCQRELFEIDRLHRVVRAIAASAFELEHRIGVELRQNVIKTLGDLDKKLVIARSRFREYRGDMNESVGNEMQSLQQSLLSRLKKIQSNNVVTMPNLVKTFQAGQETKTGDSANPSKLLPDLREPQPVIPHSRASGVLMSPTPPQSAAQQSIVASGPSQPSMEPGSQHLRAAAIQALHVQLGEVTSASTRMQTFYNLKFQQLRHYFDEEIYRISSALSSNSELWENVSEVRQRHQLLTEEVSRAQNRHDNLDAAGKEYTRSMAEHEGAMAKFAQWKRRMNKAQTKLQHETRKYEQDGLVDVRKIESECARLDAKLRHLQTVVSAEEIVAVVQRRDRGERRRMRMQKHWEGKLLNKVTAKVQVIRNEMEKGQQDRDDEPLLELLIGECEELAARAQELEKSNQELQQLLLARQEALTPYSSIRSRTPSKRGPRPSSRSSDERPSSRMSSKLRAEDSAEFEEQLCFSIGFLRKPRANRRQIDQTHGGGAALLTDMPKTARTRVSVAYPTAGGSGALTERSSRPPLPALRTQPPASGSSGMARAPEHLSPVSSTEALHKYR